MSRGIARACLEHVCDRAAMRRTIIVALIVGTVLTLVNQGDNIVAGAVEAIDAVKIAVNYLVPWIVSSVGYISARRAAARHG